jgi:cytochrome c oxidase assembly protein subunit 15
LDNIKKSPVAYLALFGVFFAFSVIALGAFTRLVDAGLGCPDWPGCFGHLAPTSDLQSPFVAYKAWAEMIHRYFAGMLSLLIMTLILLIFSRSNYRTFGNKVLATSLLLLVGYQIILGKLTVTMLLLPVIVTQHLLGGYLIVSTLWLIYLCNQQKSIVVQYTTQRTLILSLTGTGVVLVFIQMMLGAWTSTNYASLSCPNFPMCDAAHAFAWNFKDALHLLSHIGFNHAGGLLNDSAKQTIQMMHRIGALIIASYIFALLCIILIKFKNVPKILRTMNVAVMLLFLQIALGVSNVLFHLPIVIAVGHTLCAVMIFLTMLTLPYQILSVTRETDYA